MEKQEIATIRKDYKLKSLIEEEIQSNPLDQFKIWWEEAINSNIEEVNAMTLATADINGKPSARIVLLKDFTEKGFIFYTNYNSNKGQELNNNAQAALVFFWAALERQVRIEGKVLKVETKVSNSYFKSRPKASQISTWASPQSKVIPNREWLNKQEEQFINRYTQIEVPRPSYWGGYIVNPIRIEFWQGRPNRLHDRIQYTLQKNKTWKVERLAP